MTLFSISIPSDFWHFNIFLYNQYYIVIWEFAEESDTSDMGIWESFKEDLSCHSALANASKSVIIKNKKQHKSWHNVKRITGTETCVIEPQIIEKRSSVIQGKESCFYIFEDVLLLLLGYAAAKSLQSCLTLCDPIDGSLPGSAIPGILQARTLEWVAISFSNAWKWKAKVKSLSHVRLFVTPRTAAYQAPPSMGFSRQEYWSGWPLLSLIPGVYLF